MGPGSEVEGFVATILAGDRLRTTAAARRVFEQHGVAFLYESLVAPSLCRVGELWFEDRLTVADEHLATATVEAAIASLYPSFSWPPRGRHRAIVACAQGERHALGARMVADLLALDGWDDVFLGADVPIDALVAKVVELQPTLVAVSVTLPLHVPFLKIAAARIREGARATKIIAGGHASSRVVVDASLGVDVVMSRASQAVEAARGWR
jgi:methanogenic corrinoid protein MtbC1